MLIHDKVAHGGPLLFKLIANETSTTNETNQKAIIITIVKIYKTFKSCKGDIITDVVDLFWINCSGLPPASANLTTNQSGVTPPPPFVRLPEKSDNYIATQFRLIAKENLKKWTNNKLSPK